MFAHSKLFRLTLTPCPRTEVITDNQVAAGQLRPDQQEKIMYTLMRKHRHQTKKSNLRSLADIGKSVSSASRLFSSQENGKLKQPLPLSNQLLIFLPLFPELFFRWTSCHSYCYYFLCFSSSSFRFFSLPPFPPLPFSSLWASLSLVLPAPWTLIARSPQEHPVPCSAPRDSEEACEVTRSSSMGYLCKWGCTKGATKGGFFKVNPLLNCVEEAFATMAIAAVNKKGCGRVVSLCYGHKEVNWKDAQPQLSQLSWLFSPLFSSLLRSVLSVESTTRFFSFLKINSVKQFWVSLGTWHASCIPAGSPTTAHRNLTSNSLSDFSDKPEKDQVLRLCTFSHAVCFPAKMLTDTLDLACVEVLFTPELSETYSPGASFPVRNPKFTNACQRQSGSWAIWGNIYISDTHVTCQM